MGHGEARSLCESQRQQLHGTQGGPHHLQDPVLPVVPAHDLAREPMQAQQFANLVGVARRQKDLETPSFKPFDDGDEKRYVRRIIQVDPYFPGGEAGRHLAVFNATLVNRLCLGDAQAHSRRSTCQVLYGLSGSYGWLDGQRALVHLSNPCDFLNHVILLSRGQSGIHRQ